MVICLVEGAIQIGMIPSNTNHAQLQEEKGTSAIRNGSHMTDGVRVRITLCCPDGREAEITLETDVRKNLLLLLKKELIGQ